MDGFTDKYRMNSFLKGYAQDYIKNPCEDTMTDLLAEIIVRIEDGSEALTPMVRTGDRIYYDTVSDGQDEWIQVYTDWDELRELPDCTMSMPIRSIVEDAFESRRAEGIILNLNSEEVFIGKPELDWILYMLAQREAC